MPKTNPLLRRDKPLTEAQLYDFLQDRPEETTS
jgi:hypothetical protein